MTDQERLEELLDRWEEAHEQGSSVSPQELCASCPELLPQLQKQISALRSVDEWMSTTIQLNQRVDADTKTESVSLTSQFSSLSVHAKGGLGIVFAAQDQGLYRNVAIKFLQRQCAMDQMSRRQFSLEAEVTSRLEHPGVVPVYGLGEADDGLPFYVMRFIEGHTLDEAIAEFHGKHSSGFVGEQNLEFRALLNRFISVCKTIAYAHNRGILHRDIKPANVMLGRYGETIVVDWGLAMAIGREGHFKLQDEKTLMPQGQSSMDSSKGLSGTPAYMSPEQVAGSDSLQPASDIYSLGCTLYKILTSRVPFDADSMAELRQKVIRGDYAPPSQHTSSVSKALQAICLKAMSRNPADRYATAMELADDVERYLADEPVRAFEEPFGRSLARWSRRHRRVVQTAALALTLLLVLTVFFSLWQVKTAQRVNIARQEGLVSRSSVAANAVASELDRRLLILEGAARDQQLVDALKAAHAEPTNAECWQVVNDWLTKQQQFWTNSRGLVAYAWFVNLNDGRGTQIARAPQFHDDGQPYESIGSPLAMREYFHGLGPVRPDVPLDQIQPITQPQLSAPFQGTHGQPVLAFTVPVWSQEESDVPPLGVLGMAVEVFDITSLDAELGRDQLLTIVHTKLDFFDKENTRRGLIMQHDVFRNQHENFRSVWLEKSVLDRIKQSDGEPFLDDRYDDPLLAGNGSSFWLAAFAPVVIKSRVDRLGRTGWCVIIQEQP